MLLDMNTIKRRCSKMNVTINAYVGVLRIYDFAELSFKNSAILTIWELQRFSLHVHCCISMLGISILIPSISSYFLMGFSHLNSNPNPVAYLETQTVLKYKYSIQMIKMKVQRLNATSMLTRLMAHTSY